MTYFLLTAQDKEKRKKNVDKCRLMHFQMLSLKWYYKTILFYYYVFVVSCNRLTEKKKRILFRNPKVPLWLLK